MSNNINDGGPAFPDDRWQAGMTLRDYFAAAALQGMLCDGVFDFDVSDKIANDAYELADAMLERRKR